MRYNLLIFIFILFSHTIPLSLYADETNDLLFTEFSINGHQATINNNSLTVILPYGTDITVLTPQFSLRPDVIAILVSNRPQVSGKNTHNFSKPLLYTLHTSSRSEDYIVKVHIRKQVSISASTVIAPGFNPSPFMISLFSRSSFSIGAVLGKITLKGSVSSTFSAYTGSYNSALIQRIRETIAPGIDLHIQLHKRYAMEWGLGALLDFSAVTLGTTRLPLSRQTGLKISMYHHFYPVSWIELALISEGGFYPAYNHFEYDVYNTLRVQFIQKPGWLSLFVEGGGLISSYAVNSVEVLQGLIIIGGGISFNLHLPHILRKSESQIESDSTGISQEKTSLAALQNARSGDTVQIDNIRFLHHSTKIDESSYDIIKEIAGYLKKNPAVLIALYAYGESDIDPIISFDLSIERAQEVKSKLVEEGVRADRIRVPAAVTLNSTKSGSEPRVIIKIL